MATTNLNTLVIQHSRNIGDPISTASDSGKIWTCAQRTAHIDEAIRRWILKMVATRNYHALRAHTSIATTALASNSIALTSAAPSGPVKILGVRNVTDGINVRALPLELYELAKSEDNTYLTPSATNQYYVIHDSNIELLDGSTSTTDSIATHYVVEHTALSVVTGAGGTDIVIPSEYWSQILDLAHKVAMEELPEGEGYQAGVIKEQQVDREIGLLGQVSGNK